MTALIPLCSLNSGPSCARDRRHASPTRQYPQEVYTCTHSTSTRARELPGYTRAFACRHHRPHASSCAPVRVSRAHQCSHCPFVCTPSSHTRVKGHAVSAGLFIIDCPYHTHHNAAALQATRACVEPTLGPVSGWGCPLMLSIAASCLDRIATCPVTSNERQRILPESRGQGVLGQLMVTTSSPGLHGSKVLHRWQAPIHRGFRMKVACAHVTPRVPYTSHDNVAPCDSAGRVHGGTQLVSSAAAGRKTHIRV